MFSDTLQIRLSVSMESLFKHLLTHCDDYDIQTFELIKSDGCGYITTLYDVSLIIDMSMIGNITSPELSRVLHDTSDQYHVIILAIPKPQTSDYMHSMITLTMYMILVNKVDMYPRLTVYCTPTIRVASIPTDDTHDERQSQFHLSVRNHRRKLGYGSLNTPTSGSGIVINDNVIQEEMRAVKVCKLVSLSFYLYRNILKIL